MLSYLILAMVEYGRSKKVTIELYQPRLKNVKNNLTRDKRYKNVLSHNLQIKRGGKQQVKNWQCILAFCQLPLTLPL